MDLKIAKKTAFTTSYLYWRQMKFKRTPFVNLFECFDRIVNLFFFFLTISNLIKASIYFSTLLKRTLVLQNLNFSYFLTVNWPKMKILL